MKRRNLVVFIDSLPYAFVGNSPFIPELQDRKALVPGLGYSVNIKAEIFGGYSPDQVGDFKQWMPSENGASKKYSALFRLLGCMGSNNYIYNRATHKALDKIFKISTANIPWRFLPHF